MPENTASASSPSEEAATEEYKPQHTNWLRNLSLNVKANIIIVSVLLVFLVIIIALITINGNTLIFHIGQQRAREEANLLRMQFAQSSQTLLKDARIVAMTPAITSNISWTRAALTSGKAPISFDEFQMIEATDGQLDGTDTLSTALSSLQKDMVDRALLGQEEVAVLNMTDRAGEPCLCLVAAVPLLDTDTDSIAGVLLVSRQINDSFLRKLSFGSQHVGMGVIYQGELVAGTVHEHPHGPPPPGGIPSPGAADHTGEPPSPDHAHSGENDSQIRQEHGHAQEQAHDHDHAHSEEGDVQHQQESDSIVPGSADHTAEVPLHEHEHAGHHELQIPPTVIDQNHAAIAQALEGNTVVLDKMVENHGVPHTVAFVPLMTDDETEAVLIALVGLEQLMVFQEQFANTLTIVFIVLILVALAIASLAIRHSITAPMHRLQTVAEEMAGGNYTQRVQVRSNDEIGKMAGAFNLMATTLSELINSLEMRVRERTNELEVAMREAQNAHKAAEQANQMKSQFLANMSHELRTPLNSIINFTRIIAAGMRGPVTDEQVDYLDRVRGSGEHLLGLINDILDLSKIEAGRLELHMEHCSLCELVRSTMSTAAGLTKGKPVELIQDIATDLPPVQADRTRMRQILLNLLSNAAKFTDEGSITVRVRHEGPEIFVSVIDTGIGIPADKLDIIFEEFRQVDSGTDRSYQGTGLGLSICKRLVDMHGGRILVESTPGAGSTFTFTLPTEEAVLASDGPFSRTPGKKEGIPVLVVDDDAAVIDIVASYLERDGYAVYGITDSRYALNEAHRIKPTAIVLDILMPYKDGWELLAACKADSDLQSIPVVLYSVVEENQLGLQLGASAYLVKPIEEHLLRTTVTRLVMDGARIVAIDDDPNVLEMVQEVLTKTSSYEVVTAGGGQEGLDCIAAQPTDLVILDLMMPEIDGFAVLEALEQEPATQNIPVVVLTAKDLSQKEKEYLSRRVNGCLAKDLTPMDHLPGKVNTLLAQVRGQ